MKIAIVVHGRFHAFDLSRALIARDHDVTVLTNYPSWAVERFGIARACVQSMWPQGVASRLSWALHQRTGKPYAEAWLHPLFGRWAAGRLARESWDVIHPWSGVSEELLRVPSLRSALRMVMRGSAHIHTQARLLQEEEARTCTRQDRPSEWIIRREGREYELADSIVTLSSFAYQSFVAEGVPARKLRLLPLAASANDFRPAAGVVEARRKRILEGEPLRILFVGALSYRKGMWDMHDIVRSLNGGNFEFRFVGTETPEVKATVDSMRTMAKFIPKQPHDCLSESYAWGDLFVFPTIEDGFAQVLAQAFASALPILTTTNSGGPDFIQEGNTGWILPIRAPAAFVERLRWCAGHRSEVAVMVSNLYGSYRARDWPAVAVDFEQICRNAWVEHAGK